MPKTFPGLHALNLGLVLILIMLTTSGFGPQKRHVQYAPATTFSLPLGYSDGHSYAPRINYENGALIENTDFDAQNPDLSGQSGCFAAAKSQLHHAGEDLYRADGMPTEGAAVTAVANGVVSDYNPVFDGYPGRALIIEHTLPSGSIIYSVYMHLEDVQVQQGQQVYKGQLLGSLIHQGYDGNFSAFHVQKYDGNDSHLHYELRYFPDAAAVYASYNGGQYASCGDPNANLNDKPGRGYTPADVHAYDFPSSGAGYIDPTDFINAHLTEATATSTFTPTPTNLPTPTGTVVSSRSIVLDYVTVTYPSGSTYLSVTQNNTCEPTSQGGLHCRFTGSGSTTASLRTVQPVARFHWSDNAQAANVYRYQVATVQHTNVFHYGNKVPLSFFPTALPDGYSQYAGGGGAACNPSVCDLAAKFYLLGANGFYTWSVDTYVAPVAIVLPTSTSTATPPVLTPTSTVPANSNGSGTCWASGPSWPSYLAQYSIDPSIPDVWKTPINSAAGTWNNVAPSHFAFSNQLGTNNLVSRGTLANPNQITETTVYYINTSITEVDTVFSDSMAFDAGTPPESSSISVENAAANAFGAWLNLTGMTDPSCSEVTMYVYIAPGETKKITLESADENALNWQYP